MTDRLLDTAKHLLYLDDIISHYNVSCSSEQVLQIEGHESHRDGSKDSFVGFLLEVISSITTQFERCLLLITNDPPL